ncbi:sugar phosphate isomerase/epimerase [Reinekea sp.]|jgi:sugar phosphate isomerase/epimerase|uniref:sugar phosphate isomerase/epimerase family protein n=1 Tax=Reinekea sp. TaxID=1970455 RepID=UPI002A82645C|nr:sugar phosphate isomerase/epimerase [Reinekea sp.]
MSARTPILPDLIASCWTAGGNADARGGKTPCPMDLRLRIEAAGRSGWTGFGLLHADLIQARDTLGYPLLRRILDDNGIKQVELEYLLDWWAAGERRVQSDQVRADLLAAVGPLNAQHLKIGPGMLADPVESDLMRENWAQLCQQAAVEGTRVAIESAPYSYFPTVDSIVSLVTDVDHPSGGLLLDIWHVYRSGLDYAAMVAMVPPKALFAVELCDAKATVIGSLFEDTINQRQLCGQGDADVASFIRAIDQIGFDGAWGVEIISNAHRSRPLELGLTLAYQTTRDCFLRARG